MPFDLRFDPLTHDLIDDGRGSVQLTDTAETAVLHALIAHFGEWWGDPDAGSRLHDLDAFVGNPEPMIADEVRRALASIVQAGRIDQLRVRALMERTGRIRVETSFRDATSSQLVALVVAPSRS